MNKYKIALYVLSGAWDTPEYCGRTVLGVSENIEPLKKRLKEISRNHAADYIRIHSCIACDYLRERRYAITGRGGEYAYFDITEHHVEISEALMRDINREMEMIDCSRDIKEHLKELYEDGDLEAWKYEYMVRKPDVMELALQTFEDFKDCNVSYNDTL